MWSFCFVCRRRRVLLGASGSVAAIKVVELASLLAEFAEVKLVLTKAARHFIQQDGLPFVIHGMTCNDASHASSLQKQTYLPKSFAFCLLFSQILCSKLVDVLQVTGVMLQNTGCKVHAKASDMTCLQGDEEEWHEWQKKGDPVLHIELRKWADLLVVAPLSANTLAKLAQGLCDNCLTSVVRAWDWSKPLLVCALHGFASILCMS